MVNGHTEKEKEKEREIQQMFYLVRKIDLHMKRNKNSNSNKQCTEMWICETHCEYDGMSMETETTWSEFPNGGKVIVEQILASEERNKPKRARLWEPKPGMWVGKLTIWVRS